MGVQIDDLNLVQAILKHGSLGAAARELLVSQPAASQRLATVERRIGVTLFERDTTGARPTAAGRAFAAQAALILAQLASLPERTLAATGSTTLSVGCIASLAGIVFSTLDAVLSATVVQPSVDHGPAMIEHVQEGALDAAFLTIASQTSLPRGLIVTELAKSNLVLLLPGGAPRPVRRRRPYAGQEIVYCTVDLAGAIVHRRLAELGANPRSAATAEAAVRVARARRCAAVVPDLVAHIYAEPGDETRPSPVRRAVRLSLVSRSPLPTALAEVVPELRRRLGSRRDTA